MSPQAVGVINILKIIRSFTVLHLSLHSFKKSSMNSKDFGLTNRAFGDFIFRGGEGVMFVPNFYGGRVNKAMHGYDSHLKSQNAIFSKIDDNGNNFDMPGTSKEIFHYLTKVINEK